MTNSRSSNSRVAAGAAVALAMWCASAEAGAKKRVVVLDFTGPKATVFHDGVDKLVAGSYTLVPTAKWTAAAKAAHVAKLTDATAAKIAKRLKVDAIVEATVEKRKNDYVIHLKLRSGKTGAVQQTTDTKSIVAKLDAKSTGEIKDGIVDPIDQLDADDSGGDVATTDGGGGDNDGKKKFSKGMDDNGAKPDAGTGDSSDHQPPPKPVTDDQAKKSGKRVAASDGGDGASASGEVGVAATAPEVAMDSALALSPGHRALELDIGLSLTDRRLAFKYMNGIANPPPGYDGVPVGGAYIEGALYPFAIGHKRNGGAADLGILFNYDRVIHESSQATYIDGTGEPQIADLSTQSSRWWVGLGWRHAFGSSPTAPVLGLQARYGWQGFSIDRTLPNGEAPDFPDVHYETVEPALTFRLPVSPKLTLFLNGGYLVTLKAGQIQDASQYGPGSVMGFEGELGADYMLRANIYVRASARAESYSFSFNGQGTLTDRDMSGAQEVTGARDSYYGGIVTIGYVY